MELHEAGACCVVALGADAQVPSSALRERLGAALRTYRERAGYSQAGIARALGVAPSTVSQWESGHRAMTIDRLHQYLRALDLKCEIRWQGRRSPDGG